MSTDKRSGSGPGSVLSVDRALPNEGYRLSVGLPLANHRDEWHFIAASRTVVLVSNPQPGTRTLYTGRSGEGGFTRLAPEPTPDIPEAVSSWTHNGSSIYALYVRLSVPTPAGSGSEVAAVRTMRVVRHDLQSGVAETVVTDAVLRELPISRIVEARGRSLFFVGLARQPLPHFQETWLIRLVPATSRAMWVTKLDEYSK
jgi:hypothetical protein